jgi:FlaA1/EpsC-like NDP-sugar epimerase
MNAPVPSGVPEPSSITKHDVSSKGTNWRFLRKLKSVFWVRRLVATLWLILGVFLTYYGAFLLRFDSVISQDHFLILVKTLPLLILVRFFFFRWFGVTDGVWRYISLKDMLRICVATTLSSIVFSGLLFTLNKFSFYGYPRSAILIELVLHIAYVAGSGIMVRLMREYGYFGFQLSMSGTALVDGIYLVVGDLPHVNSLLRGLDATPGTLDRVAGILCPDFEQHRLGKARRSWSAGTGAHGHPYPAH